MLLKSKVLKFWRTGNDTHSNNVCAMYEKSKREIVISITYIRLPDVLVVGVKKCGTGAIMQQLGIHPQMSCPEYGLEENKYFAQDLFYNRGLQSYIVSCE